MQEGHKLNEGPGQAYILESVAPGDKISDLLVIKGNFWIKINGQDGVAYKAIKDEEGNIWIKVARLMP